MKKKLLLILLTSITLVTLTACNNKLDVVGKQSVKSFDAVINQLGSQVTEDTAFGGWSISAPDNTVRFVWSKDFSKTTALDAFLETDLQPFLDAGLDASKLPEGTVVDNKIIVGTELGNDQPEYKGEITPLEAYKKIVEFRRDNIKYHTALDHYGIDLTGGNMFEWAKDMAKNDKDMVFVLNPQMFIDAGVNPDKVNGWVFAKVETMDENGKKIQVDKFLKPFELDGKN